MDYRYIFEYARRNALRPLDELMPDPLAIADFGETNLDTGKVDGKLYGVAMGINSTAMFYDRTAIEGLGLELARRRPRWAQFAELAIAITRAAGRRGYFGSRTPATSSPPSRSSCASAASALYDDAGKLGFARDDVAEWFDYWDKLRKAGGARRRRDPGARQGHARDQRDDHQPRGDACSRTPTCWSPGRALNKNKLGMTGSPRGDTPGQYYKPSMQMSIAAGAANPREAARLISFLSVDPEAGADPERRARHPALGREAPRDPRPARRHGEGAARLHPGDRRRRFADPAAAARAPARSSSCCGGPTRRSRSARRRVPQAATQFLAEAGRILERA